MIGRPTSVLHAIPTNLIMGFLGVGKTTAILRLLENKPQNEVWAVLVNEFGSVGIDGAIYSANGTFVKEVPGGCMCCAAGVPMQVAVNRLLREAQPDRLLIEPSGLGHPRRILDTLGGVHFKAVLKLRANLCLVDPRKFSDVRYTSNENFVDQIALSDVLIANKMDLADEISVQQFFDWAAASHPPKTVVAQSTHGKLKAEWLDLPRSPDRKPLFGDAHEYSARASANPRALNPDSRTKPYRLENTGDGFQSGGWVFNKDTVFNFHRLHTWLSRLAPERMKSIFATEKGWFVFNCSDGLMTVTKIHGNRDSRVEFVLPHARWDDFETEIKSCIQI